MTQPTITSFRNPRVKRLRQLNQRKNREKEGMMVVEGIHHVGAAWEAGAVFESLFYAPNLLTSVFAHQLVSQVEQREVACYPTSQEVFESLAGKDNPQGILAVVHNPQTALEALHAHNFPWVVALVSPQDPGNVGAILRTIDAVGASGLILLDDCVDLGHPTLIRASMGSLFWYPVAHTRWKPFAEWVQNNNYTVYGTSAHGNTEYSEVKTFLRPGILLMGSEREGLNEEQRTFCHVLLSLPMRGKVTSLNLAVATGVMLYTMLEAELH
jgi:TrmH family RNA methyltransferase